MIAMTSALGIAAVWLYAAIRPRYGAGPRTAVIAGLAVWVMADLWSGIYLGMGFMGLITPRLAFVPIAWGLMGGAARHGGWCLALSGMTEPAAAGCSATIRAAAARGALLIWPAISARRLAFSVA